MGVNRRGIVIEIVGDERSYLRAAQNTIASNTRLDASFKRVGVNANASADAQIAAAVKARRAMQANATALTAAAQRAPAGSEQQIAAAALAADAQRKLARAYGATTAEGERFSVSAKTGERDLGKLTRGALAGSGVFSGLGRSLAFASGGFLAFSSGAALIRNSIDAARALAVTQRQVDAQLKTTGGTWKQYGDQITRTDLSLSHVSGFTNQELLQSFGYLDRATGNVNQALKLNALAADVARGRNISLSAAALALGKAVDGSATSLRRLGIVVPKNLEGMKALAYVQQKFAGQAQAGASAADRFHATLVDSEEIIGAALLPTVNRYLGELGNWLAKMNESGRLQKDVNRDVRDAEAVFHGLGTAIHAVDSVTGSFENTLKDVLELALVVKVARWATALAELATAWKGVTTAAQTAAGAQALAAGETAGAGIAGAVGVGALGTAAVGSSAVVARIGQYTGATATADATTARFASTASKLGGALRAIPFAAAIPLLKSISDSERNIVTRHTGSIGRDVFDAVGTFASGITSGNFANDIFGGGSKAKPLPLYFDPQVLHPGRFLFPSFTGGTPFSIGDLAGAQKVGGPFGTAQPETQFRMSFALTSRENLAAAQAALTKSTQDDVAAARQVVARIKKLLDEGRLHGQALIQALGLEATALGTIWSAETTAAQKRAQAAQAAQQRIVQQIQNAIDPLPLEVALSRAQAFGQPIVPRLKALLAAAERGYQRALAAHNLALEKQALDQIASLKQQIQTATTQASVTFTASPQLQLALARDQALGLSDTKDLLKLKAAILRFIRTHKKNIQAEIDAYNQLAQVNQQLGSSATSALGGFKQLDTAKLARGLGLTRAQLKALRARLSQVGPGGTVPGDGTGAFGVVIDPTTGRVRRRHHRHEELPRGAGDSGLGGTRPIVVRNEIELNIDGKRFMQFVTKSEQRRRRRNPTQRRGPNAATA